MELDLEQDLSFLECNVRLVIQREDGPASGKLEAMDLEIAKHVHAKLDGTGTCNVIQLGMVRIVKRIDENITCIKWHG